MKGLLIVGGEVVTDKEIVSLYLERNENAILQTDKKYSKYCFSIAKRILHSIQDTEECVNDTFVRAWNSIPPNVPERLDLFLGKLTRNVALNRYMHDKAQKRNSETDCVISELEQILPDTTADGDLICDDILIRDIFNDFLKSLPFSQRRVFVQRYFYMLSIRDIAKNNAMSVSAVKQTLLRSREKLRSRLAKEGVII